MFFLEKNIRFSPTSYVKLQQAYYSESAVAGGWTLIGYTAPNDGKTTNFVYGIGDLSLNNSAAVSSETVGWQASNEKALNDCAGVTGLTAKTKLSTANWSVAVKGDATSLTFNATVKDANCTALTPTFTNIGK